MEIRYDKVADAKYIRVKEGEITQTTEETPWLLFDRAENGDVLGVEILEASRNQVTLTSINGSLYCAGLVVSRERKRDNKDVALEIESLQTFENDMWLTASQ